MDMDRAEKTVVALTGCSHAFNHGYQLIYPAALLLLQKEFSLGYLELGVIGNIMTFTYGLGALPGGLVYNRFGPKRLYLFCFLGSAAALLLVAFSPSLLYFAAGLALLGGVGSVYHPLVNALITAKVHEYGRALGIHGSAGNVGFALAPVAAGLIASRFGWRHAYGWFALSGIGLSAWALFVDMSPREGSTFVKNSGTTKTMAFPSLRRYFTLPLVCLYLANTLNGFCYFGAITFLPTYMAKRTSFSIFSLDSVALGGMLSGIVLSMGVFGQLAGGFLSQKPHLERSFLLISILAFPFIFSMSFFTDVFLVVLALGYFFFNFLLQPMANTLLAQQTTPDMRGTAFGLFFFIAFCIGSVASSFSGLIAQALGLQWVFLGLSSSAFLMVFFAALLSNTKSPVPSSRGSGTGGNR